MRPFRFESPGSQEKDKTPIFDGNSPKKEPGLEVDALVHRIPYERQVKVAVTYDGKVIGEGRMDLLIDKTLILELKVVEKLAPIQLHAGFSLFTQDWFGISSFGKFQCASYEKWYQASGLNSLKNKNLASC